MSTNEEHLNYSVEDNLGLLERIDNNLKMSPKYIRFNKFIKTHNLTDEYSVRDLSRWHMILTSSCVQGISDFAKEHNLDFDKTKMTVPKFFELVRGHYGGDIIERLEAKMRAAEKLKSTK